MVNPELVRELGREAKTKGKINETLMRLLLQLDTIQGLHPMAALESSEKNEGMQLSSTLKEVIIDAKISNENLSMEEGAGKMESQELGHAYTEEAKGDVEMESNPEPPSKTNYNWFKESNEVEKQISEGDHEPTTLVEEVAKEIKARDILVKQIEDEEEKHISKVKKLIVGGKDIVMGSVSSVNDSLSTSKNEHQEFGSGKP
eukprot:Gb_17309 [translate_table: standard]